MQAAGRSHDRSQYQGKRLFYLLLAFLVPAGLLYVRIVLGLAAGDNRVGASASRVLAAGSLITLVVFFAAQALCTLYVQRLMPPARTRIGGVFQYGGVFVMCLFISLTVAISLEAFGFDTFLRTAGH